MNYTMHWVSQQETKFCSRILEKEQIGYEECFVSSSGMEQLTMMLLVKRSAPLRTIMTKPMRNIRAPMVRIKPGAFS